MTGKNIVSDRKTKASGRISMLCVVIGKWQENAASDRKTIARGRKTMASGRKNMASDRKIMTRGRKNMTSGRKKI